MLLKQLSCTKHLKLTGPFTAMEETQYGKKKWPAGRFAGHFLYIMSSRYSKPFGPSFITGNNLRSVFQYSSERSYTVGVSVVRNRIINNRSRSVNFIIILIYSNRNSFAFLASCKKGSYIKHGEIQLFIVLIYLLKNYINIV